MPRARCSHNMRDLRQIHYNDFECVDCRMVFFGIERNDPKFRYVKDYLTSLLDPMTHQNINPDQTHIQVNLGTIPQDILDTKNQLKEMEKALSMFAEVLKSALQT